MKITIISPAYPYRGGIADFSGLLYKHLNEFHDVNVITFSRLYPSLLFPGKTQFTNDPNENNVISDKIIDSINPVSWLRVGKKIKEKQPDIIIIAYWMPFFALAYGKIAKLIKQNKKTKIVLLCHNVLPHEKKFYDKSVTKYLFNKADYFVLLSKYSESELFKLMPKAKYKVLFHPLYSVFGNGIEKNDAQTRLGISFHDRTILFFGIIRDYKGLDILIEALAKTKDIRLIIAGEFYSNREKYIDLIEKFNLKERIILMDRFIPSEEIKYIFSAVDAVILPYREATQSGILQIAFNFHKPVIASNCGGLAELILDGETGIIVKENTPEKLAEAINDFFENNYEEKFAENIRRENEKYSWGNFVSGLIKFVS
ncbi:MAG: glycosyltransferase [Melioribacteraceae bacterium]|nr:glycosyltransferase [Melioribacteraceae bacterium]